MKTPKRHINRSYNYSKLNNDTFVSQSHDIIFNPLSDDQIKISELPESSGLDNNDIIPIVEISGAQLITKKISFSNFANSIMVPGSGNYLTKFNSSGSGITNSIIYETGNKIGLGTTTPEYNLHIIGSGNFSQNLYVNNIPVSVSGHSHSTSDITNFGSGVSGLLVPYATIDSPNLTGIPTAPTASSGTNTNQIASTAFVRTEISNLINSAPVTLDTLNELASALDDDPNFATTIVSLIGDKVSKTGDTMTGTLYGPSGVFSSGLFLNGVAVSVSGHQHISADITNFTDTVTGLFPSAFNASLINGSGINLEYNSLSGTLSISTTGVSVSGHTHSSVDITDFDGAVSGLLPNSYDAAVPWTTNHTLADGTRYLINDLVYESGHLYKANYDNESLPVSNTTYWTDVGPGYRLNIDGRDIPNIPYPVKDISAGSGVSVTATTGNYTIDVTGPIYPIVVTSGSVSGNFPTDVSTGEIFDITLIGSTTLSNPTNSVNGATIRWRITQDGTGGHSVILGSGFQIASSATSPLPWSTGAGATDILAATYHASRDKWDIVSFVPGY